LKSGPVGQFCNKCQIQNGEPGYGILRNQDKILDSITIAEMFNQGHETAKADQCFTANMDKRQTFNSNHLRITSNQIHRNIQDPVVKADLIHQLDHKIYAMLEWTAEQRQQECVGWNLGVTSSKIQLHENAKRTNREDIHDNI
jgi:hypothetical protein